MIRNVVGLLDEHERGSLCFTYNQTAFYTLEDTIVINVTIVLHDQRGQTRWALGERKLCAEAR